METIQKQRSGAPHANVGSGSSVILLGGVLYTVNNRGTCTHVHGRRQEQKGACMDLNCSYAVNQQTDKASNTRRSTPAVLFQRLTSEHTQTHRVGHKESRSMSDLLSKNWYRKHTVKYTL